MISLHLSALIHTPAPPTPWQEFQQRWPTLMPFYDGVIVGHEPPDVVLVLTLHGHKRFSLNLDNQLNYHE